MDVTTLAGAMWAAGSIEEAALLVVLLWLRRWRSFPFFTAYMGFNVAREIVLFAVYRMAPVQLYADVYWTAAATEFVLQLLVIYEVMHIVVPSDVWGDDARRRFRVLASAGVIVALALSFAVHSRLPHSVSAWIEQALLFTSTLSVVLLLAMALSTTFLGLVWRRHVAALGTGLAVWGFVDFLVEGAYSYFGADWHGVYLDNIRIIVYQAVTVYWIVMFLTPDTGRRTLSSDQETYLRDLQLQAAEQAKLLQEKGRS